MITRNVTLTLEKAREFYNSGIESLKEIALQAFTRKELMPYTDIKDFIDAYKALGLDTDKVYQELDTLDKLENGRHLVAIYKLDIIRKALNGDWNPSITKGVIYCPWVKFYLFNEKPSYEKPIATFKANGQKYFLISGFNSMGYSNGLGCYSIGNGNRYGCSNGSLGLLACKSAKIAEYMSKQFGQLIFDACYSQYVGSYKWLP